MPDTSGTLRSDDWTLMVKCVPFSKFEKQENNNKKPFARWKTTKIGWKKLNVIKMQKKVGAKVLSLKIIYRDRNKSFQVIRMSIEDYYLVPIKKLPRLCKIKKITSIMQNIGALKHLNKWTETGCTLNRMQYASLTMQRIHQLGLWQMHIFRSNASIFVDFIWLIFDVKFIEISVKIK